MEEEIIHGGKSKTVGASPLNDAPLPRTRGGARVGAGRKPDQWQAMFNKAAASVVTQDEMTALVVSLLRDAKSGNISAVKELLDRLLGKVKEKVEVTGENGTAFQVTLRWPKDEPLP